jgi:3-hydroxyisobutyrate dehydrogenase
VADTIDAKAIAAFSMSGQTAMRVARERPDTPILGLTHRLETARRMALVWGVHALTCEPTHTMTEPVAQAAAESGLAVVDCPVSGSPAEAGVGKLILIVGGDRSDVERAEPLLKLLGTDWKYTGGVGTAKVVKIVNNMMSMGNVLVAAEAFALGVAAGVEPDKLYEVLSVSGGRSHHFTKRFPNALKGDFSPGFKLELGEKDLALGIELGRSLHLPTPTASTVRELYAVALANGFRGQDIVALLAMYQGWAKGGSGE